jgi:hypothetical protein
LPRFFDDGFHVICGVLLRRHSPNGECEQVTVTVTSNASKRLASCDGYAEHTNLSPAFSGHDTPVWDVFWMPYVEMLDRAPTDCPH